MVLNAIKRKQAERLQKEREQAQRERMGETIEEYIARHKAPGGDIWDSSKRLSRFLFPNGVSVPKSLLEIWDKSSLTDAEFGAMMRKWIKSTIAECQKS